MKAERSYPRFTITPKAEAAILRGHPWVYDQEVLSVEGTPENGKLVDILRQYRTEKMRNKGKCGKI